MASEWMIAILIGALAQAPAGQPAGDTGQSPAVAANPDDAALGLPLSGNEITIETVNNGIIIKGSAEDVMILEQMLNAIDQGAKLPQIEFYRLQNARAADIATKVQRLLQDIMRRVGSDQDFVTVQADERTNTLMVAASDMLMPIAMQTIENLDKERILGDDLKFRTFTLKHLPPSTVKTKIEEVLEQFQQMRGDTGPLPFNIEADDRTNTIRIYTIGGVQSSVESDLNNIEKLINQLDVEPDVAAKTQMVVLPLLRAEADKLVDVVREMISTAEGQGAINEQISRLRLYRKEGEELEPLPELNVEKPIRLIAADGANAVIVGSVEENIPALTAIVALLDTVPLADDMSIRLFPLQHADAKATMDLLTEIFDKGQDLPKQPGQTGENDRVPGGVAGKALVYNINIQADQQTNTVIVAGRIEQVLLAQQLINDLDVPGTTRFPLRIIELENAGVARVETILREMIDARLDSLQKRNLGASAIENERVFITTEKRSNSLIVSAKQDNYEEILSIVTRLDNAPDRLADQIRIVKLTNTSAADLADRIESLFTERGGSEEDDDVPVIIADPRSNSLIMSSSPEDYKAVQSIVAKLEELDLSPLSEFRLVSLKHNDASEIANTMEDLFEKRAEQRLAPGQDPLPSDKVAIGVDSATNSLIVVSSPENFEVLQRLVDKIDIELEAEGLVQSFTLINANAVDVADRITDLWDQGIYRPGSGVESDIQEERNKIAVIADPRANAVVVSASRPNFAIVRQLVETLDADPTTIRQRMRIFKLEYADAIKIADVLRQYFEGLIDQLDDQKVLPQPTIIPDDRSNAIIFSGTNDSIVKAESLVKTLDVERTDGASAILEVYPLQYASSQRLATTIDELFQKREESDTDTQRTPFQIYNDERTNSLIVSGSREDQIAVKGMLATLDQKSLLNRQMRIFSLAKAQAEELADSLNELFDAQRGGGSGGGSDQGTGIAITPDERTNSLIVWASPSDLDNIEQIVNRLDNTDPVKELIMKIIRLRQSDAETLAEVLNDAISGSTSTAGGRRSGSSGGSSSSSRTDMTSVLLSFVDTDEQGKEQYRTLLRQDISIVPDTRTNSVILVSPPESIDMLASLVRQLDTRPQNLEIRIFALHNANAEEMKDTLDALFRTEESGSSSRSSEGEEERRLRLGDGSLPVSAVTGDSSDGRQQLAFTVDRRTNSIIAAGTEEYLMLVEKLIEDLDAQADEERATMTYAIRHSTAEEMSTALQAYFDAERDRYDRLEDETSIQRQIEREVTVVPSEETNTLLLNYDPRREGEIMRLVRQLDRPPPQVMIQVLLAEITIDDRLELGMEWAYQDLRFTETGENFDFVVGTDVGAAGAGSLGGFSFTITGEDFNFLLRMLQTEGRLTVLSRPSIMVQDNQEAMIEVADRVPFVRGVTVSDTGATQSNVEYEDVGIILEVVPHINPDGFVNMEVRPEISGLTPSSITITEGLTAPVFSSRRADTVITVKDGETIVIGGLIQQSDEDTENKIPIAGDIPYIGPLFRSTSKTTSKAELLIILTPHIVRTVEDAREVTEDKFWEHSIQPQIRENPLWDNLQVKPGEQGLGPVDTTDIQPLEAIQYPRLQRDDSDIPPLDADEFTPKPQTFGPIIPSRAQANSGSGADGSAEPAASKAPAPATPSLERIYMKQRQ